MLVLNNIKKDYFIGNTAVPALKGISVAFRANEFVSILGQSGCGKTTLLNIIGGLDRYTTGDLLINGRSTKSFKDADWDTYRNHSIGFVFQSYNLIPHQTVLTNVELALTISGVSKAERVRRATEALEKVGLGDQLHKKPNQMSGGQMQRVAIARAIVNDPEILLADEPTGALDSETSVQIMEILRQIASDRLVIMVTHNPELAQTYSTRIIRLQDGRVVDDTSPYDEKQASVPTEKPKKKKKPLSFKTAFTLSLNNLMTKKARTFLTSFAGSIGIIGIALILSLSSGINTYIANVQEDALSSYPVTLEQETQDYSTIFNAMVTAQENAERQPEDGKLYVDDSMVNMLSAMMSTTTNDLTSFKAYLEEHKADLDGALSDIRYTYNFNMQIYSDDGQTRINPTTLLENMGPEIAGMVDMMSSANSLYASQSAASMNVFREMLDNQELLQSQYDVIAGSWTSDPHEVMLVVSENNSVTNLMLYALGLEDQSQLGDAVKQVLSGKQPDLQYGDYTYNDFLGMTFYIVPNSDFYVRSEQTYEKDDVSYPIWEDVRLSDGYDQEAFAKEHGIPVRISAILRKKPDAVSASLMTGTIAYDGALSREIMGLVQQSDVARQQTEQTPDIDVLSGLPFDDGRYDNLSDEQKIAQFESWIANRNKEKADIMLQLLSASVPDLAKAQLALMSPEEIYQFVSEHYTELAEADAESFKPLLLHILQTVMGDRYAQYAEQFAAMNANDLVQMLTESGQLNPDTMTPEQQAAVEQMFTSLPADQQLQLAEAILTVQLTRQSMEELLQQYTPAQLVSLFDSSYGELTNEQKLALYKKYLPSMLSETTYDNRIVDLGFVDFSSPASISLYVKDFASKDRVTAFIDTYNQGVEKEREITFTDLVGLMMSSITTIIDAISYVLIAFVSISLVVSSIMIGIITYISVLERTKEIGILRAIGASKHDISRVFNAETLLVGFCAGAIGILATILLCLPINAIIHYLSGINSINAALPVVGGIVLVAISMFLTFIAGLIPARLAAKKDPVLALRTE